MIVSAASQKTIKELTTKSPLEKNTFRHLTPGKSKLAMKLR
jgi:hypothetical protein